MQNNKQKYLFEKKSINKTIDRLKSISANELNGISKLQILYLDDNYIEKLVYSFVYLPELQELSVRKP